VSGTNTSPKEIPESLLKIQKNIIQIQRKKQKKKKQEKKQREKQLLYHNYF